MNVCATTVASWMEEDVVRRSPWLTLGLAAPQGTVLTRSLAGGDDFEDVFAPIGEPSSSECPSMHKVIAECRQRVLQDALSLDSVDNPFDVAAPRSRSVGARLGASRLHAAWHAVSMWCQCGVNVVSMWCQCGVNVVSMWCRCGVDVVSMWYVVCP
ncbi:unnamed protein product [Symbiodinium natans]|uniref:Uncharacterized protein n=1 Tax=Symbiodinium natans TaxID=878477 RepID=A0A812IJT4_9DINO|nr:unnamed protein product [Symbiodinium natans]